MILGLLTDDFRNILVIVGVCTMLLALIFARGNGG